MSEASTAPRRGPIVVDLQAVQSGSTRGRGIGRFALEWAQAIEVERPDLVGCYLLNDLLPPPGDLGSLLETGKVSYSRATARSDDVLLMHVLSPFDLSLSTTSLAPPWARELRRSVMVYDLIPGKDPEHELTNAVDAREYRTRLEIVRNADAIQTLSDQVSTDLSEVLDVAPSRVAVIGAAASSSFVPPESYENARQRAIGRFSAIGLSREYVFYPSGSHPRKNNEALVTAWRTLDASIRARYQLVIVADVDAPTINHYRHLCPGDDLVLTGYVSDEAMLELYQGAFVVCFPSLSEGLGLPILEAQGCATPVIGSDRSPMRELLESGQRFDPTSPAAIAVALTSALSGSHRQAHATAAPTWRDVARASAAQFDGLLADVTSHPRPMRRGRPRIAFVTPLPPAPTGVAAYSYRLIEEMIKTDTVDVDVFRDGPERDVEIPGGQQARSPYSLGELESLLGRYDGVVYTLGNSHHHLGAITQLRKRPGVVFSHDVRLSNLYRHLHGDPGFRPGGFACALHNMYPDLPAEVGTDGLLDDATVERYGVLMAREAIALSTRFFVTSTAAVELARLDATAESAARIQSIDFAMENLAESAPGLLDQRGPRPAVDTPMTNAWGTSPPPQTGMLIGHFGIVDASKEPELLLDAFAGVLTEMPNARLAFAGPISDALAQHLVAHAQALGIDHAVSLTGALDATDYQAWLRDADLAVQLRRSFHGEASAAIAECLTAGLATVVTDIGWSAELDDDAVIKVERNPAADRLSMVISDALADDQLRVRLGEKASALAARHSFASAARQLLDALGVLRRD